MDEDIIAILAMFLVVFVPVVGITARIALKPFNEVFLEFLKSKQGERENRLTEQRLAFLEQEMLAMRTDVATLNEQKDFYRRLAEGAPNPPEQRSV
jgi:hypothetical protein